MSVRKYPSRALSIEEWETILLALENLEENLQEQFQIMGNTYSTVNEEILEALLKEVSENVKIYKELEPNIHIVGDSACRCMDCLNHLEHSE